MKIYAQNCGDCPMGFARGTTAEGYVTGCRADSSLRIVFLDPTKQNKMYADEPPDECPLRKEPIELLRRRFG